METVFALIVVGTAYSRTPQAGNALMLVVAVIFILSLLTSKVEQQLGKEE